MRSQQDIEDAINRFGDTVWRACLVYFRPGPDAEDAFQDTFYKYAMSEKSFNSNEHTKAWLIRVATNICKDILKAAGRNYVELDEALESQTLRRSTAQEEPGTALFEIMEAMRKLDDPPRTPVYLSIYEGYTAPEIAEMLSAPVNTVYSWVSRGKQQLKEALS